MMKLTAALFAAAALLASSPVTLAQDRATESSIAGVRFPEIAWNWQEDGNGSKLATVSAAAAAFGRACADAEFFAFQTAAPDALAASTMESFKAAGWQLEDHSGKEGPLYYRAALEGAELAVAWTGVDSGAALFICNTVPASSTAADSAPAKAAKPAQLYDHDDGNDLDFSRSPAFFASAFGAFGLLILGIGLYGRRRASASARWPVASGTVVSSELGYEAGKDADGDDYECWWPDVRYSYSVSGSDFMGSRVRFGPVKLTDENKAKALLAPYPAGAKVDVFYNPANPKDSTLETVKPGIGASLFIGGVFILLALFALAGLR